MATNNAINNTLPSPFTVGATSVVSTGTQLNLLNTLTAIPFDIIVKQVFTASGTYTPTIGMLYCKIEVIGGGGAGGGTPTASGASAAVASGGSSGGYSFDYFTAATIGASQSVTVGAGGTGVANSTGNVGVASSVGALISANGGLGGVSSVANTVSAVQFGVAGATQPAGTFNKFPGNPSVKAFFFLGSIAISGPGAPSYISGGANNVNSSGGGTSSAGIAALANSGAGGSGSYIAGITGTTLAGGNGGSGIVIITEYCGA